MDEESDLFVVGSIKGYAEVSLGGEVKSLEDKADWIQTHVSDKPYHNRYGLYTQ